MKNRGAEQARHQMCKFVVRGLKGVCGRTKGDEFDGDIYCISCQLNKVN